MCGYFSLCLCVLFYFFVPAPYFSHHSFHRVTQVKAGTGETAGSRRSKLPPEVSFYKRRLLPRCSKWVSLLEIQGFGSEIAIPQFIRWQEGAHCATLKIVCNCLTNQLECWCMCVSVRMHVCEPFLFLLPSTYSLMATAFLLVYFGELLIIIIFESCRVPFVFDWN